MTAPSRRAWVGTSWKMNKTRGEAVEYLRELADWARTAGVDADVTVFPPFTALGVSEPLLHGATTGGRPCLRLGAQNVHWWPAGAQTGEVSVPMLLDAGVDAVEIGHRERRAQHGETDETVGRKAAAVVAAGLEAVVCVGETDAERRHGAAAGVVTAQVEAALADLPAARLDQVVIAYEPAWAIGTGSRAADPDQVRPVVAVVRALLARRYGSAGDAVRVVYGGSVDSATAARLRGCGVDGLFVGRAALTAAGLIAVVEAFAPARAPLTSVATGKGTTS